MTNFTVHSRSRYGVYRFVGACSTRKEAQRAATREILKGVMANVWIRFQDEEKIYEWDHEHETMQEAMGHLEALAEGVL